MADVKISNLANLAAAANDDELVIVDVGAGTTKKIEALDLVNTAHTHDGETLQLDGVNSNGGAFIFTTSGLVTFNQDIDFAGQLGFPAVQNASAGANDLDDYEEGTWTPGITFGGAAVGLTYVSQLGYYTKVGNIVFLTAYIQLSNKGSSNGNALITGLPFTVVNNPAGYSSVSLTLRTISFANQYAGFTDINTTTIVLEECTEAGTRTALTDGNFANTSILFIGAFYRVA